MTTLGLSLPAQEPSARAAPLAAAKKARRARKRRGQERDLGARRRIGMLDMTKF
jgi:hypothetical protein